MEAACRNFQMVCSNGDFCETEVKNFIRGLPANEKITVVSIIGPRTTGKSSLLNALFETDFQVLPSHQNFGHTTEGIWIARCRNYPSMVIMDVEGSDSRNRAEDVTSFEYRAALLALTISDVLLLNIPADHTHSKNHGGFWPLLRTIFQERESLSPGRTRVVVTLRDCHNLTNTDDQDTVVRIVKEIWESVSGSNKRLQDNIEVSAVQFPDANESQFGVFQMKLAELWEQIPPAGLKPLQDSHLTAATFLNKAQEIWAHIRTNRSLNIPSFNELMSRHRCETIMQAELSSLDSNEKFSELRNMDESTSPKLFQTKQDEFLFSTLVKFEAEAAGCIIRVKDAFKAKLKREIITKLEDTFVRILMNKKHKIGEENKVAISKYLRNTKKGVLSSIFTLTLNLEAFDNNDVVSISYHLVTMSFDDQFRGCCEEYRRLVPIFSNDLKNTLKDYSEQETKQIEKHHKISVLIGKGTVLFAALNLFVLCNFGNIFTG